MAQRKSSSDLSPMPASSASAAASGAKERRFMEALRNVFVGAKVSGQSGHINLMHIKARYFSGIVEPALMADVEAVISEFPDFREELFDKLHAFFSRYFSKSGSICFAYTPRHMSVYEKVYTDEEDVVLFWKTHMLYFVKTDRLFRDLRVEVDGHVFGFDCTALQHKKANEKRALVYAFEKVENNAVYLAVTYSERGRNTKPDEILKSLKKAGHPVPEAVLDKAMQVFARQSEVDYFINKDAATFLREQFDLWLYQYMFKDETRWTEQRVRQLQTLKDIAFKLIAFIAQFEDELVRIWNKPKFVRGSRYIITLDRIAARDNDTSVIAGLIRDPGMKAQVDEWKELSIVDAAFKPAAILEGKPSSRKLADACRSLPIDTCHFKPLESSILGLFDDLDQAIDARLIKSENYQALNTLQEKFKGRVKMIYIDPPYNTGGDGFQYQDAFRHASWITMLRDRLDACHGLLAPKGVLFSSIDDKERRHLEFTLDSVFGRENRVEEIIWVQNTTKNQSPTYSTNHEYVEVYARDLAKASADERMFREPKPGYAEIKELIERLNPEYPTIAEIEAAISNLYEQHRIDFRAELEEQGVEYDRSLDLWKGLYNYSHAEYRDANGKLIEEKDALKLSAKIWIWREDNPAMPPGKQAVSTENAKDINYRYYKPLHPFTGEPCPHPKTGWRWPYNKIEGRATSFSELADDDRIVWGETAVKIPQAKKFIHEVDTQVSKSVVMDFTDGEKQLTDLVGTSRSFNNPKPTTLISRFILQTTSENDWILDFFAGSGTTGHAAFEAFRTDQNRRRFMLIESAKYFDDTLVPRVKRIVAASRWKSGKPVTMGGPGIFCKVYALEQYEETLGNALYAPEGDLFRNAKSDAYAQYVFLQDPKMVRTLDLDYRNDDVTLDLERLYPDIDLPETLSCITGKWIKRIGESEVEFTDGSTISLRKPDWRYLKPLIFWGPSA